MLQLLGVVLLASMVVADDILDSELDIPLEDSDLDLVEDLLREIEEKQLVSIVD